MPRRSRTDYVAYDPATGREVSAAGSSRQINAIALLRSHPGLGIGRPTCVGLITSAKRKGQNQRCYRKLKRQKCYRRGAVIE